MRKFKVGDRVKILSCDNVTFLEQYIGHIGTITLILNSYMPYEIKFYDNKSYMFTEKQIILYEPASSEDTPVIQIDPKENMGIRLNAGKPRWRNFPLFLFEPVIKVGSFAEKRFDNPNGKYETFNFLKGMYVNDCLDSLKRHLMKFESPYESDNDEETQESHLAHIAWNALVALHMLKTRPELDDRYKIDQKPELTDQEKGDAAIEIQKRGR